MLVIRNEALLCDGSHSLVNRNEGVAGIGVVVKLVNRDDLTDEYPLLYAWNKLRSSPSRPDLAERQAILFASVVSNHVIHRRRIRRICRPGNLISATILNDCQGAVRHVQTILNRGNFAELLQLFKGYYDCDLTIEWEGNRNHGQQHPLALVDGMARNARMHLPVGQTVYAHNGQLVMAVAMW